MATIATEIDTKPPYISFRTILTILDKLKEDGVPARIDRSYWKGFLAGGYGPLVLAALRFLGLVTEDDRPTVRLQELVQDEARRPEIMRDIILERYAPAIRDLELTRATSGMVDEAFKGAYSLDGQTLRKAQTFFVHAAQFAKMPLSNHILRTTRKGRPPKLGRAGGSRARARPPVAYQTPTPTDSNGAISGNTKTVTLRSGGTVALTVNVDWFTVDAEDREFCLSLIDRVREYGDPAVEPADTSGTE